MASSRDEHRAFAKFRIYPDSFSNWDVESSEAAEDDRNGANTLIEGAA